jgi:dCTP diphosphatase
MSDDQETIGELRRLLAQFIEERAWEPFHTPKNLAMALAVEAAELMEHFQWLEPAEALELTRDPARRAAVAEELADVVCYALAMTNALGIELGETIRAKMVKNAQKYPADQFRGRWGSGDARAAK